MPPGHLYWNFPHSQGQEEPGIRDVNVGRDPISKVNIHDRTTSREGEIVRRRHSDTPAGFGKIAGHFRTLSQGSLVLGRSQGGTNARSPANTTGLLSLPPEIILIIGALLRRYRDLNALILTHPQLANILSSQLYRRALAPHRYGGPFLLRRTVISKAHSRLRFLLTSYGVNPNEEQAPERREETLLHVAIAAQDFTSAQLLLEAGIDVDARDSKENTALHLASRSGNIEMIKLLLKAGIDVDARDSTENTALHLASHSGNIEMIKLLHSHGANLEAINNLKRTPLVRTLASGPRLDLSAAIKTLLKLGADPNVMIMQYSYYPHERLPGLAAWSPLHRAAVYCINPKLLIRLFVSYGADLEVPLLNTSDPPCTPLACLCKLLIWHHVVPTVVPLAYHELAQKECNAHWKAVECLLDLGAKIEPALLSMKPRPNLAPKSELSSIGNQHPIFTYYLLPADQTLICRGDKMYTPLITEERWENAAVVVKERLERVMRRVSRRELSLSRASVSCFLESKDTN